MKNRIISLLLVFILLFSFSACGEYNPPDNNESEGEQNTPPPDNNPPDNGDEEEPFVATVMINGKPYTPPTVSDDSLALKVRWTDGKAYHTVTVDENGRAECFGLDGDYTVTLVNLSDDYTYNPNIYTATNNQRNLEIQLYKIVTTRGHGDQLYNAIEIKNTGLYCVELTSPTHEIFFEFAPPKSGTYSMESWMDTIVTMMPHLCV